MSTQEALLIFYFGFGFCIFLGWAGFVGDEINPQMIALRRVRYDRGARLLAVVGLLHPGLALCGLDVARQLARLEEEPSARSGATLRSAGLGVVISLVVAAAVSVVAGSR
jgi:hypothetical protein